MEVLAPLQAVDFNLESGCSTPFMSAPTTPKPTGGDFYYSAPTSPTALFRDLNNISFAERCSTSCDGFPCGWEELMADTPKYEDDGEDFAFDFSGQQLERPSLTAEELFAEGKIRPLRQPQHSESTTRKSYYIPSPKSPKSSTQKANKGVKITEQGGQERVSVIPSSKPKHRATRSLCEFVYEEEQEQTTEPNSTISKYSAFFTKWRLTDILLFRSSSEGQAANKDPLKKYSSVSKRPEDLRHSSFRSTGSSGPLSSSKGKEPGSARLLPYTANQTSVVQDKLKRKTFLPYKRGLLGCIGFNPTVKGLVRGLNSIKRG